MEQTITQTEEYTNKGQQYVPFSVETNLLSTAEKTPEKEKKFKMPSFKNIMEEWRKLEYPFNQVCRFY